MASSSNLILSTIVVPTGFLCDEMGLGKTLETLMLVLASQPPKGWAVTDLSKVQRPAPSAAPEPVPIRSTLIVMPANLLQQWQDELAMHVQPGALKWCGSASLRAECVQTCLLFFVISVCCLASVVVIDPRCKT